MVYLHQRLIKKGKQGMMAGEVYQAHARTHEIGCDMCAFKSDAESRTIECVYALCGSTGTATGVYFVKV